MEDYHTRNYQQANLLIASISHTSAPASVATVASFRTWRGSRPSAAKGPILAINRFCKISEREGFEPSKRRKTFTRFPGVLLQPLGHLSTYSAARKGKLE
jgi:hypothetical protein